MAASWSRAGMPASAPLAISPKECRARASGSEPQRKSIDKREGLMAKGEKEQDGREALDTATVQLVLKETKELIRALEGTATSRVVIQSGALQIEVERGGGTIVGPIMAPVAGAPLAAGATAAPSAAPGMMPIVA